MKDASARMVQRCAQNIQITDLVGENEHKAGVERIALRITQTVMRFEQSLVERIARAAKILIEIQVLRQAAVPMAR